VAELSFLFAHFPVYLVHAPLVHPVLDTDQFAPPPEFVTVDLSVDALPQLGSNYLGNNILMSEMFLPFWLTEPLTAAQHQKMEDSAMFSTNGMPSRELYDAYPRYEPDAR
jgi:hypothetical protein